MAEDRARPEDYRLLGISPEVTAEELDRAYHRVRALYSEGSLATYSLMDGEERSAMRDRIEEAHLRVERTLSRRREAEFTPVPSPFPDLPAGSSGEPSPGAPGNAEAGAKAEGDLKAEGEGRGEPAPGEGREFQLDWSSPPGLQMKRIREDIGITLQKIASVSRIRSTHFSNIEEGKLGDLPAPVYLRGFLLEYARRVGFPDPESFATRYLAWVGQQPGYKG